MPAEPFIWDRLLNRREDLGYVGVFEKPDTELMKMIVDMYPDEPSVLQASDQLMNKRKAVIEGEGQQYQEYVQKEILAAFVPDDYNGSTKIGRAYTNSLFQRLHTPILNTIFKQTHVGLDIRSSFSTMLVNVFRDVNLPFFQQYVHYPNAMYGNFTELGVSRADVKKLVNGTICAWPRVFEDPEVGNMAELGRYHVVQQLREDVGAMATAMRERYPGFVDMVDRKCLAEGKVDHVDGTALFLLASDMEHSVMRVIMHHIFEKPQISNVVWKYDGILVPMSKLSGRRHDEVVTELQRVVADKLDVNVAFKVDDLSANSFGICINPADRNREDGQDAYERWKARFEKQYVVLKLPPTFLMYNHHKKTWKAINKDGFQHNTMTEPKDFIKRWHEDPDKRVYWTRDFVPPPLHIPGDYLNTYNGIAADDLPRIEDGEDIGKYMRHVDILVGNLNGEHPDYAKYLHDLMAYKFQYPGLKWRVMPIVLSAQGVGKDLWFDFIMAIMGNGLCVKRNGISDVVGKNSFHLDGKLLCCFQEMGTRKLDRECEEELKTYITNKDLMVEAKHENQVIQSNVVDFIGFSNKPEAVVISADDRRFFVVSADGTYAQDDDYITPLLVFFNDDKKKRAVYDFYMTRDISGFNPSRDRPITETQKEMMENQVGHVEMFLKDAVRTFMDGWRVQDDTIPSNKRDFLVEGPLLRVSVRVVNEHWMEYAKANNFKNHESKKSMEQFLRRLLSEMLLRTDKFKSVGIEKLVRKERICGGMHVYFLDHRGIKRYLASIMNDGAEEEPPAKRPRVQRKVVHTPGYPYEYQIHEGDEVVFESNDMEEINRMMLMT